MRARGDVGLLTARVRNPSGLGRIVRDADGGVRAIVEERDATPDAARDRRDQHRLHRRADARCCSGGSTRLTPAQRAGRVLPDRHRRDGGRRRRAGRRARRRPTSATVRGINDRAQLAALERIVQRARARRADATPARRSPIRRASTFAATLTCGRDVRIDVGCVFEGDGEARATASSIGPYCVLRDVDGRRRHARSCRSRISNRRDDRRATAASVRTRGCVPAPTLADDVHIGNFVEVKASTLGAGAKANHLAYIGDAVVGSRRQLRRRLDHRELRRREQAPDDHRRRRARRLELRAGRADHRSAHGATIGGGSTIVAGSAGRTAHAWRARGRCRSRAGSGRARSRRPE